LHFDDQTGYPVTVLEHHKVRVSFVFMGREMEHRDIGLKMLDRIEQQIVGIGTVESRPQMYGNRMVTIIVPQQK